MAGRSDIEAGRAFIRLYVRGDLLAKGLKAASREVSAFGDKLMGIGTRMLGVGLSIGGALAGAVAHFTATGSALADMSARTGVAGSALAELGFAAEQTGASLEDVESGIRKMQKTLEAAKEPGSEAAKAIKELGLSLDELKNLSPDKQLQAIGEKLSLIEDPGERAAKTMELLGKSGTKLTPMLANLANLRAEANRLGFGLSDDDIARADAFGDAIDRVKAIISGVVAQVGSQLLPAFEPVLKVVETIVIGVGKWVKENGALFRMIAGVTAGIISAGAGILAFGIAFKVIAVALSGFAIVIGAIGSGIALLSSIAIPFALAAGVVLVLANNLGQLPALFGWIGEAASTTGGYLLSVFGSVATYFGDIMGKLFGDFSLTWQGISDAIAAGDLTLAMEVASAGMMVIWERIASEVGRLWDGSVLLFSTLWGDSINSVAQLFTNLWAGVKTAFTTSIVAIELKWLDFMELASIGAVELGHKMGLISREAADLQNTDIVAQTQKDKANAYNSGMLGNMDTEKQRKAAIELLKEQNKQDRKPYEDKYKESQEKRKLALAEAEKNLKDSAEKAKDKRIAVKLGEIKRPEFTAPDISTMAPITGGAGAGKGGSFSAAALSIMGGGGGPMERMAKGIEAVKGHMKDLIKIDERQIKALEAIELRAMA